MDTLGLLIIVIGGLGYFAAKRYAPKLAEISLLVMGAGIGMIGTLIWLVAAGVTFAP